MDAPRISERLARLLYPNTLAFLVGLAAILILVSILVRLKATYAFDLKVTRELQEWNPPIATALFKWLTFLANGSTLVLLTGALLGLAWLGDSMRIGLYSAATLVAAPLNLALKSLFKRERPQPDSVKVLPGAHAMGTSYPSGHSMAGMTFYGFLAVLVWLHIPTPGWREALLALFAALPFGIGISRIYLGAHWLSDVVGGWAAGTILLMLFAAMYRI